MTTDSLPQVALLERTLNTLAARTGFPVAFGGFAESGGTVLTSFAGTRTGALRGLVIQPGQGLGGLALARRELTATGAYQQSPDIIHSYDREIGVEGIITLLAIPVVVDNQVRALIYAGLRDRSQLTDETLAAAAGEARRLAWELSVHEETERRLAVLSASEAHATHASDLALSQEDLTVLYTELRDIARLIEDPELAQRLSTAGSMLRAGQPREVAGSRGAGPLSPRELDVLTHLALGKRNALIGAHLDLAESTVKSYIASAMRKLEAANRFDLVLRARSRGLIP
ncbi:helix-turn-helix transcriptional regulator [Glutamicibacter soli]|uniref:Helix-turn-helix transcriptional regulator n=1 Tax=Glutamicibacter soli TaxID=453836 RepID=A0A365YCZ7_9MICC|nr:LuxR C-terminal-related transcriptional regulator [Glutamicibacter soli]RBM00575.1 helix-turn-helix transcriptional regulator [Glutamicibacter soli]